MKILRYLLMSFSVIFLSCKGNSQEILRSSFADSGTVFIRDIPLAYTLERNKEYRTLFRLFIGEDIELLGLENLTNGFDSLCIRIWLGHSMSYTTHVVCIERKTDRWTSHLTTISKSYGTEDNPKYTVTKQVKEVVPKSGWKTFLEKLLSYNVTTLPDKKNLEGYNDCGGDGLPFYFEVSTSHKYRFYTYCNVEGNLEKFPEAKNVNDIGKLLESEFGFTFIK